MDDKKELSDKVAAGKLTRYFCYLISHITNAKDIVHSDTNKVFFFFY